MFQDPDRTPVFLFPAQIAYARDQMSSSLNSPSGNVITATITLFVTGCLHTYPVTEPVSVIALPCVSFLLRQEFPIYQVWVKSASVAGCC